MDDRAERILALLRERGGRVTAARRAIVVALLRAPHHVTAEELAAAVQAQLPDVHQSTVYRCLDTLTELGIVTHVHVGRGPVVYHLVDEVHHHLACQVCGAVIGITPDVVHALAERLHEEFGFVLDAHLALAGRCRDCELAAQRAAR